MNQFVERFPSDKLNAYVLAYLADMALEKNDLAAAQKLYERSLHDYPDGPLADDCRFGLARAMEDQGHRAEARKQYQALAEKAGSAWADQARYRLGRDEYAAGEFQKAIETWSTFDQQLSASSLRPQARLGRAQAMFQLQRYDEAQALLGELADKSPLGVEARYWLGLTLKAHEQWPAAAEALLLASADGPDHSLAPAIAFHAGDALLRSGKPAEALVQFNRLLEHWPNDELADDALVGKLRVALTTNDGASVDATVTLLTKQFPKSELLPDARRIQARSLLVREKFAPAAAILEPLVKEAPTPPTAAALDDRYLLALAYQGLGRAEDVLRTLEPVSATSDPRLKADAVRLEAAAKLALKKYPEAIATLNSYLESKPTGDAAAQARAELVICYAHTRQFGEARTAFEAFVHDSPSPKLTSSITVLLAEAALEAGQFEWSTELFTRLLKEATSPRESAKALSGLGWSQFKSDKRSEALESFNQLVEKYPQDEAAPDAALVRGQILERDQKPQPALDAYLQLIDHYPTNALVPQALAAAAHLQEQQKNFQQAEKLYGRLAKDFPQLSDRDTVIYNRAWVLRELGRTAESDQQFEELHAKYPKSRYWPDAAYRLAESAMQKPDHARAKKLLTELIESKPSEPMLVHALYLSGQLAIADEKWAESLPPLSRLVQDYPESPLRLLADFWIAEANYRLGNYSEAGKQFTALAPRLPEKREAWMAMVPLRQAQILVHQKLWDEAQELAQPIAANFPEFEQQYEVDYVLGRCLAAEGDFDKAREAYGRVIRSQLGGKTETAAMAQWMIGESYFHQKNYEAAIREYLRLEILYAFPTWQGGALLQAAKCHEALGEWPQAVELYARLLKNYPQTTFAEEATRRLQSAQQHVQLK